MNVFSFTVAIVSVPVMASAAFGVPTSHPVIRSEHDIRDVSLSSQSSSLTRISANPFLPVRGQKVATSVFPVTSNSVSESAGRGVYVSQVGDNNQATLSQRGLSASGKISQTGDRNVAVIDQRGSALQLAEIKQIGVSNDGVVDQSGTLGGNSVLLVQSGANNTARAAQMSTGLSDNSAVVSQYGDSNTVMISQDGSSNSAELSQRGDDNRMTVSQLGVGNRLAWSQEGNNLTNLSIAQTGGQSIQITQSR